MSAPAPTQPTPQGLEQFDEQSRRELSQFLEQEQVKAQLQTQIHTFTERCFDKCVPGAPGARFSRSEESCLSNCVDAYMNSSLLIVKYLESRRGQM
ncbi:protein transporter TIM8 [Sporobolomyces koalae]|uniref:protein transporter TIM8 n=1 Tax=Sporobolomyces koalae TaxID=500713 RepID=UPI00317800CE